LQTQSNKLTWGGNFKSFKDQPHYELSNWKMTIV
jgi:hypothetical protein